MSSTRYVGDVQRKYITIEMNVSYCCVCTPKRVSCGRGGVPHTVRKRSSTTIS